MNTRLVEIGKRQIGSGQPCFIIAEAGVNHNGDIDLAMEMIRVAAECKADAVKFQTFNADRLVTKTAAKARYQMETTGAEETQHDMLKRLELSASAHRLLQARCRELGILFLSTPFDEDSADLLDELVVPAFKVSSGELTNLRLLAHIAAKQRPMILSTGMGNLGEVERAVSVIERSGNPPLVLLHCVSSYPADPADANLRAILTLASAFGVPAGYSDHTIGIAVPIAAVAIGACVIEKHFTLDRNMAGPDHRASLEPDELRQLIEGIRAVEKALGDGRKHPVTAELEVASVARKSLVASVDIHAGSRIAAEMITLRRPGTGLAPDQDRVVIGRTARVAIPEGTVLSLDMLS